jgi:hypothetical protein
MGRESYEGTLKQLKTESILKMYLCTRIYSQMENQTLPPHVYTSQLLNIFSFLSFVVLQQSIQLLCTYSFFDGGPYFFAFVTGIFLSL